MKRLAALSPINALAARVTKPGIHFKPYSKPSCYDVRDVQPQLKTWAESTGSDLTGRKFGRFTVVGYSAEKSGRWVVKCQCGNYEFRRSRSVTNPANDLDMCQDCRATHFIKHGVSTNHGR
jgi:hypothetical protein